MTCSGSLLVTCHNKSLVILNAGLIQTNAQLHGCCPAFNKPQLSVFKKQQRIIFTSAIGVQAEGRTEGRAWRVKYDASGADGLLTACLATGPAV